MPDDLVPFLRFLQMNRLHADDAGNPAFSDQYSFGQQKTLIDAADGFELQHAIVENAGDQKAHFIHMGFQHNFFATLLAGLFRKNIAHPIHRHPGAGLSCQLPDDGPNLIFISGDACGLRQTFQYFNHSCHPSFNEAINNAISLAPIFK